LIACKMNWMYISMDQAKVDKCVQANNNFHGEYSQHLSTLQKLYAELLAVSSICGGSLVASRATSLTPTIDKINTIA